MLDARMACWRNHCFSCLQFLLLALFQMYCDAYISVDLSFKCLPEGPPALLRLQPKGSRSAAIVELNVLTPLTPTADPETGNARCRLEVIAPQGHVLTVHLDKRVEFFPPRTSEKRQGFLPCFLKLSHTGKGLEEDEQPPKVSSRTIDLCDGSEMPVDSLLLTNHLILAWSPPDSILAERMIAMRLIITAVGRGVECNSKYRSYCLGGGVHLPLCIASELACDGFNNCPLAGDDEDPEDCSPMAIKSGLSLAGPGSEEQSQKHVLGTLITQAVMKTFGKDKSSATSVPSTTTTKPGQKKQSGFELTTGMLRDMSDLILKKLLSKHKGGQLLNSTTTSTTVKPPWHDVPDSPPQLDTFPGSLAHYGPWGYLLIGMLICGAVLLMCGLWECCCRAPKHNFPSAGAMSTAAATTVFIINNASGIGTTNRRNSSQQPAECPPSPGPPSYEELDQPPPYSLLFPMTKISATEDVNQDDNRVIDGGEHI